MTTCPGTSIPNLQNSLEMSLMASGSILSTVISLDKISFNSWLELMGGGRLDWMADLVESVK